ncbi:MAG: 23S rRNA (pseudouridine(1915)-N(3))-methyltransferase RlmH [Acutalibacteraceae bacterium]|nr:23S rRNA (pseudouridine(1915)-N(3))-methyltransferase RlmH [Acutalibacteraceae bacterium]
MMNITVIALGKLKEKYLTDAINEYSKRISAYGKLQIIELTPVRLSDNPSQTEIDNALSKEAEEIKKKIPNNSYVFSLCIEGKEKSSESFAKAINDAALNGKSNIVFIIGSSFGLSPEIKSLSDFKLSFSPMTFPHQLMRVMLLEQIYRAFQINNNGKYHK